MLARISSGFPGTAVPGLYGPATADPCFAAGGDIRLAVAQRMNYLTAVQDAGGRLSEAGRLRGRHHPAHRVSLTKPPWKAKW